MVDDAQARERVVREPAPDAAPAEQPEPLPPEPRHPAPAQDAPPRIVVREQVREQPRVEVERPRCPFCHEGVNPEMAKAACDACMAWHHKGCWGEGGGCSACGARSSAVAAAIRPTPRGQAAVREEPAARPRRRRGRPVWKTALFTVLATWLVAGGLALLVFWPKVLWLVALVAGVFLVVRASHAKRARRSGGSRARGGRRAG